MAGVCSESNRAHRLLADRVLDDGNFSGYSFLLPSESYVAGSCVVKEFTLGGNWKFGMHTDVLYNTIFCYIANILLHNRNLFFI